jgi:hypothetical protein
MTACGMRYDCVAPDAWSGVARRARNEALTRASALRDNNNFTRRFAPRGGRGVRPYTRTHD